MKNIKICKTNTLEILSTWNEEFESLYGSYSISDIQDYMFKKWRKHLILQ